MAFILCSTIFFLLCLLALIRAYFNYTKLTRKHRQTISKKTHDSAQIRYLAGHEVNMKIFKQKIKTGRNMEAIVVREQVLFKKCLCFWHNSKCISSAYARICSYFALRWPNTKSKSMPSNVHNLAFFLAHGNPFHFFRRKLSLAVFFGVEDFRSSI